MKLFSLAIPGASTKFPEEHAFQQFRLFGREESADRTPSHRRPAVASQRAAEHGLHSRENDALHLLKRIPGRLRHGNSRILFAESDDGLFGRLDGPPAQVASIFFTRRSRVVRLKGHAVHRAMVR